MTNFSEDSVNKIGLRHDRSFFPCLIIINPLGLKMDPRRVHDGYTMTPSVIEMMKYNIYTKGGLTH